VFAVRSDKVVDRPNEMGLVGGVASPEDIERFQWNPMTTMARKTRDELGGALEHASVRAASAGTQPDGQFAVTVIAEVDPAAHLDLVTDHLDLRRGGREHQKLVAVPMTLDGLTAALCAPASSKGDYSPYPWTPSAVAAAHLGAAQFLSPADRRQLTERTRTVESMAYEWRSAVKRSPDLTGDLQKALPDLGRPVLDRRSVTL
jgi:hypothetical protein